MFSLTPDFFCFAMLCFFSFVLLFCNERDKRIEQDGDLRS